MISNPLKTTSLENHIIVFGANTEKRKIKETTKYFNSMIVVDKEYGYSWLKIR